jgi:putative salt-induced outer membrane protein YdiY
VKGTTLEGKVESITKKHVMLETDYGSGSVRIRVKNVEAIETEAPFHVFHGDDVHTLGRVVGVSRQAVTVEVAGSGPTEIPFDEVYAIRRDPGEDGEFLERAAVKLAYWSGNYDLNFSASFATDDNLALGTAFGLRRERGPSRLRLGGRYRLSMQKLDGESRETTQNDVYGELRQEYDLTDRLFAFGQADAEYDQIEELTIRTVPTAGLGYALYKSETTRVSVEAGGGYVYQRFFGGDTTQYPTAAFGAESDVKLGLGGARWLTRIDYTPAVAHWADEWLLRGESSLLLPIARRVSIKATVLDTYNSAPADETDNNSLTTLLGVSLGF